MALVSFISDTTALRKLFKKQKKKNRLLLSGANVSSAYETRESVYIRIRQFIKTTTKNEGQQKYTI